MSGEKQSRLKTPFPNSAFVLAAGFGSRLRPLTHHRPKPLLPICGITLLDHARAHLGAHGIDHILVNAHHLWQQIAAWTEAAGITAGPLFRRVQVRRYKARAAVRGRPIDSISGRETWDLRKTLSKPAVKARVEYDIGTVALHPGSIGPILRSIIQRAFDLGALPDLYSDPRSLSHFHHHRRKRPGIWAVTGPRP